MPPLPKTCSKAVCPKKGVAFLWKTFLQKNFQVWEKIPPSALAFGCSHALVAEGFTYPSLLCITTCWRSRSPTSSCASRGAFLLVVEPFEATKLQAA